MRSLFLLAASFGLATAANAVTVTSANGAPDPGPLGSETWVIDYETPLGAAVTGNYQIVSGNTANSAAPAGDMTHYFSVPANGTSGMATLDFTGIAGFKGADKVRSFSFYWGSIDKYNKLELLDAGGNAFATYTGSAFGPATGSPTSPTTNKRVFFKLGDGETLSGLRFTSTSIAFEHDDVAVSFVPEPGVWAMMIAGFGFVGLASRRRRRLSHIAA